MNVRTVAFECPVESADGSVVLRPTGELDIAAVPGFEAAWTDADTDDLATVVLDLRELEFIDSSGLRSILDLRAAIGRGTQLSIIPGPPRVHRVFELTGVEPLLPFSRA